MFAGHVGIGLAAGRALRTVNVAVLIAAALLLDVLLWLFVLLGWESVRIPVDFAAMHQPQFTFPWSHGLFAAIAWSALAGTIASRARAGWVVAAVVFSHWMLDALVHRPELPLAGGASAKVGLGLWDHMPLALAAEAAITVLGLCLFLSGSPLARGRAVGLGILVAILLVSTGIGTTVAPAPPSAAAMAASSLVTIIVICALFAWLGRNPRSTPG